jgi:predicted ATPase
VEYVFRHAILRDVTYDTVIPRQRRALHKLVADWLIEVGGERAGEHTLLVAEHYARAEEASLAGGAAGKGRPEGCDALYSSRRWTMGAARSESSERARSRC